jgi:hypothetical protein
MIRLMSGFLIGLSVPGKVGVHVGFLSAATSS